MKGWTLIETLIVVAIVGIVVAVAAPHVLRAMRTEQEPATVGTSGTLERYVDHNAGVACWTVKYPGHFESPGLACLPLEQTRLRAETP